jgi:hypothetical protein
MADKRDALALRLQLAERIAGLPGIHTEEDTTRTLPWYVDVYLRPQVVSLRKQRPAVLLCTLTRDTVRIHGLNGHDGALLDMPRDVGELDACWAAIQRTYSRLLEASAARPPARTAAWADQLPRFSRTSLQ